MVGIPVYTQVYTMVGIPGVYQEVYNGRYP